jgi:hypothetical protein
LSASWCESQNKSTNEIKETKSENPNLASHFRRVWKLRKATISLVMSSRLSVCPSYRKKNYLALTGKIFKRFEI